MVELTVLQDRREQLPWTFETLPVTVEPATLRTGDYSVAELCDYDAINDTYLPNYAVERKSGEDFVQSVTYSRERFESEIERAADWERPLPVLIEEPTTTFTRRRGFMKYREVTWSQLKGTVDAWEERHNVGFQFVGTRQKAQSMAYDYLSTQLRQHLL